MKEVTEEYNDLEEAVKQKPAELFHIWRDGGEHKYYTSGDVAMIYPKIAGDTYFPATITRSLVTYDAQLEITKCTITVAYVEDPVLEFIGINPIEILWISIMRVHREQDPIEADVIFLGQIKSVSFKGIESIADCVGFEYFLNMPVPLPRYQINCNWKLFDSHCKQPKVPIPATIGLDVTGTKLTSATFGGYEAGYFIYGTVEFGDEIRTIVDQAGDTLTMAYRMRDLIDGSLVDAYPGCDGRIETCRDKFDNILRFLGFPFTPVENPELRVP